MNTWIVKNIKFGYKYTTNKLIRINIKNYFDNYLLNILSKKGSNDDNFIIVGGMFSNVNPSAVAISDAVEYITKISQLMKVIILTTPSDIRQFDGEDFSILNIFSLIDNVYIKPFLDRIVTCDACDIDVINGTVKVDDDITIIPNIIQFDDDNSITGVYINRNSDNKHTIISNKFSPKHVTYEIETFEDFEKIEKDDNNIIHLIINDALNDSKERLNLEIFRVNAISVKYKTDIVKNVTIINEKFDIISKIYNTIGNDDNIKKHFNKILNISRIK